MLGWSSSLLIGLTLLVAAHTAEAQQYKTAFDAIMRHPNATRVKLLLTSMMTKGLPPDIVQRYQYMMPYLQNEQSTITLFAPVDQAIEEVQLYACMTAVEFNNYMATQPELVMDMVEQTVANTTKPVTSKNFRNNLTMPTFKKGFNITLQQKPSSDGTSSWAIPRASLNSSDITITAVDIPAGKSVMHLINGIISSDLQRAILRNMSAGSCSRPGAREAAAASLASGGRTAENASAAAPASATPTAGNSAASRRAGLAALMSVLALSLAVLC